MEIKIPLQQYMLPAFFTPLVNYLWADSEVLHKELKEHIFLLENQQQGLIRSNVGGWHSELSFMQSDVQCVSVLRERLLEFITDYTIQLCGPELLRQSSLKIEGWANVLRHGQYNSVHNHPNCYWSGVYYLSEYEALEEHSFSGKLELLDPRPGASANYQENDQLYGRFLLSPTIGQMIIFPSWLMHQVHPYFGERERISIAFNVSL